jgi:2-polyprenyl-3-methyl-5-hydroxy-6-metoxy-1,4-benzoquinol methylase
MKTLDRNQFIARKLGKLNNEIVLDVGCRESLLKTYLEGDFKYIGIDFDPTKGDSNFINHNMENGLPKNLGSIDIINAADVLEHIENIHEIFNDFFKLASKKITIALPNMAYYKFRLVFCFSGEISGKYIFHSRKITDRHKWFPTYFNNLKFIKENTPKNWKVSHYKFIFQRKRNFVLFFFEKFFAKIFPKLFVYENIFIIEKIN